MIRNRMGRRILALLLAVCLLMPTALAAEDLRIVDTRGEMQDSVLSMKVGEDAQLRVTKEGGGSIDDSMRVEWSSTDEAVAAISDSGRVEALAAGSATITADVYSAAPAEGESVFATVECTVTVVAPEVESITLNKTEVTLAKNESQGLTANVVMTPPGETPPNVTWTSDDESIAAVIADSGKVTGKAPGQTTITAKAGGKEAKCTVTVTGLDIDPHSLTLSAGSSGTITKKPYGLPASTVYYWTTENELVARVDSNGKVTGVTAGECKIKVETADEQYSAVCNVTVRDNTANVITEQVDAGQPLSFSDLEDEIDDQCGAIIGGSLSYVTNLSVPTNQGILYYSYVSADDTGSGVAGSSKYYYESGGRGTQSLSNVTFVAKSDFSGTAEISYTGYNRNNQYFTGVIRVTVDESEDVVYSTGIDSPVTFRASDFSAVSRIQNGRDVNSVRFTLPASRYGTLYYNYIGSGQLGSKVESGTDYYRNSNPALDKVTFVPADGYNGTVKISYSGTDTSGSRFSGRVTVYVSGGGKGGGRGDINYKTSKGKRVTLRASDFNSLSKDVTGENLNYVRFSLPSSSEGTLYYNYRSSGSYDSKVGESTKYYRDSSPYISNVSFVPRSSYEGTVDIDFTGYDRDGEKFSGTVEIQVGSGSSSGGDDIEYHTDKGEPVDFVASDFNDVCKDELDDTLHYVRFSLPDSSDGTLYYKYRSSGSYDSKVGSSTKYYRDSSPYLSDVTFVPKSSYTGTVDIDYTGYGKDGDSFSGTVTVRVGTGADGIKYKTKSNRVATFTASDFNNACKDELGDTLNYVRFSLPDSGKGTLYYNYSSSGTYDSAVSESTKYYRTSSPSISKVSFVAKSGYTGTVELDYTGYDTDGDRFTGTVTVQVGTSSDVIKYETKAGHPADFSVTDFSDLCKDELGDTLSYVRFTLPASSKGTLYYKYSSAGSYDSKVSASTKYYRSTSPTISNLSFVPASGYTGTAEIAFTGYDTDGDKFTGTVSVTVSAPTVQKVRYTTAAMPVAMRASDFDAVCNDLTGKNLDSVQFTPPSSSTGRLYYNYSGPNTYGSEVRAATVYYRDKSPELDQVVFVPKAGYEGTASVSYTGKDTAGQTYTGTVEIAVSAGASTSTFRDMYNYGWASASVEYLNQNGIVSGTSSTTYEPGAAISRGDFVLMICRAFGFSMEGRSSFPDVPQDSYYAGAVAAAKNLGVTQGSGDGLFHPGEAVTRQDAMVFLMRAMQTAGYSVSGGPAASISGYSDSGAVASYAVGAVAAMSDLGVIRGDDSAKLNPSGHLTRAEMAVILHRALTL